MQPPTTVRCWELAAAELRGSVGTYMRWRSALRGQRCLIAIGIPTPPARYGRRGSLHATRFAPWRACPRHSINIQSLNAMVNELTVTHREGDRNDLRICRVCRCACGERARNRSTGAPGTTTCHELFCRSGRNGIALHIIIMDTITNILIFKKCRSLVTQSERFCRVVQPSRLHLRLTRVRNSLARHANLDTHGAFRVSEWSQS